MSFQNKNYLKTENFYRNSHAEIQSVILNSSYQCNMSEGDLFVSFWFVFPHNFLKFYSRKYIQWGCEGNIHQCSELRYGLHIFVHFLSHHSLTSHITNFSLHVSSKSIRAQSFQCFQRVLHGLFKHYKSGDQTENERKHLIQPIILFPVQSIGKYQIPSSRPPWFSFQGLKCGNAKGVGWKKNRPKLDIICPQQLVGVLVEKVSASFIVILSHQPLYWECTCSENQPRGDFAFFYSNLRRRIKSELENTPVSLTKIGIVSRMC